MPEDGNNFNSRIEGDLSARLFRLIEEIKPLDAEYGVFDAVLGTLYTYPVLITGHIQPPYSPREPWKVAVVTIAAIYARLWETAAAHRSKSVEDARDLGEFWDLQAKLDSQENEWREQLGLPKVDSQS